MRQLCTSPCQRANTVKPEIMTKIILTRGHARAWKCGCERFKDSFSTAEVFFYIEWNGKITINY
jgi:hypothetical protein